ncbi:glycogen/starch/alpha-glucan phosphorylase [Hansschlegelia quercus]|uniref:Alpha-1,4 glucan phosphorylase n=1 Tax=Hansschlegelia quercus TaxID=2528245 RepID=A0A4Q9GL06_9HYPH|nr:glycogen/starch/alpha-glucan phosphorylase [Hansschlegelia quercus]
MNDSAATTTPETAKRPVRMAGATEGGGADAGVDVAKLRKEILAELTYSVGRSPETASKRDWFVATAYAVRDRIVDRWVVEHTGEHAKPLKRVYYLSLEFLIGRLLFDALNNLGLTEPTREALAGLGIDLNEIRQEEPDAALGNGGLGRLAACFMDSMASIGVPAFGYGIRYDHGLFRQGMRDGWQQEYPEDWLSFGNPWEFAHPEIDYPIGFGGYVEQVNEGGQPKQIWRPGEKVEAVAFDIPVVGWRGRHVNTLRLWSARAPDPISLDAFNRGDYVGALSDRVRVESISKVLYPSDETPNGQELRLRQEYFFASASLQDLVRRHMEERGDLRTLPDHVAIQLNDTHPAIAVPELMRILVDLNGVPWAEAWAITNATFSYTNHTLLPEALESWPVPLMERLLPRHMQIIYLINALELEAARAKKPADDALLSAISLIDEGQGRRVRMGILAFVGSHKVNGVSALHTDLMKQTVFRELHALHPDRIVNKTNGITFRRWLAQANPRLTKILIDAVGVEVLDDPTRLEMLADMAGDSGLQEALAAAKRENKLALARVIAERNDVFVDPDALFDVQIKRIHEYKRQLLNILETIAIYNAMRAQPMRAWMPRVKIFAGKAAASYHSAKLIIKLANDVARVVNSDPTVRGLLKVAFLPNYNVSLAEIIIPAADLSEQISTAGMEASGTGNMKLALNGALTIGTLDGANVEIKEHVGDDNIFIFGLTAAEVEARKKRGYDARAAVEASSTLREVLESIRNGVFSPDDPSRYAGLVDGLLDHDTFLVTADFDAYFAAQRSVYKMWRDRAAWMKASAINTAKVGWFSSDRTIGEYAKEIWDVKPAS